MSQETREKVAAALFYQDDGTMKAQILDETKTNTLLIGGLEYLIDRGHLMVLTALAPPTHHDDSDLNPDDPRHTGTHAGGANEDGTPTGGFAADLWFLTEAVATSYMDAGDHRFALALTHCSQMPSLHQIGLAGSAVTDENKAAAGFTVFVDEGGDHVHIGFA
jgi:hypothetical protein